MPLTINEVIQEAHDNAFDHGWWAPQGDDPGIQEGIKLYANRNIGEQIALFHSELSEALEEWRNGHDLTEIYYELESDHPDKPEGFPIELADLVIRIADTCGRYGIDLEEALVTKMRYNRSRPYRHGGKKA